VNPAEVFLVGAAPHRREGFYVKHYAFQLMDGNGKKDEDSF
jgi:hypothetical protein